MHNPVVELDGDEMTRIIWDLIKKKLILPYLDIKLEYYDLGIEHRDKTDDKVTVEAAEAIKRVGVGVKCATITPDEARVEEFHLKKMWKSPNGTIRNILGGVIFREPIICKNVPRLVPGWTQPIVIGRHAFGDQYKRDRLQVPGKGKLTIKFVGDDGKVIEHEVFDFPGGGVAMAMYNLDEFDPRFRARLDELRPEPQISASTCRPRTRSSRPMTAASRICSRRSTTKEFAGKFKAAGITYEHRLIDDMVASALKWSGGYVWACKNYDGDVQSDTVAQGFGSLGLMTSVLLTPDGKTWKPKPRTARSRATTASTRRASRPRPTRSPRSSPGRAASRIAPSSTATPQLDKFAHTLEKVCVDTVEAGFMTKDLALLVGPDQKWLTTEGFLDKVDENLKKAMA